eukprot:gene10350-7243_t
MTGFCLLARTPVWRRSGGSAGIVGLPNVGKSTLFNALTCSQMAKTGNFPFCTIKPNMARATVVDERLHQLAAFSGAEKVVEVEVDLVDVAGLIEGASRGAGLGSQFLADVRPCAVVLHMVRCFESVKDGFDTPNPLEAIAVIENELILSDLEVMEKRADKLRKGSGSGGKASASGGGGGSGGACLNPAQEMQLAKEVVAKLSSGLPASAVLPSTTTSSSCEGGEKRAASASHGKDATQTNKKAVDPAVHQCLRRWDLLTAKPTLYVLNVDETSVATGNLFTAQVENKFGAARCLRISAALEEETSQLTTREERLEFLRAYGLSHPQSERLLHRVMRALKLQSFFTVGPLMAHGWRIPTGSTVRQAAGAIHSDFATHFVRGHVQDWEAFMAAPSLSAAERSMRTVDEHYVMQDGEVLIVDHSKNKGG